MQDDHSQSFNVRFVFLYINSNKLVFVSKTDLQVAQCVSKKI